MQEVMKAKKQQTEAQIEESKGNGLETVEQRKARLMAQRDLLREHKKKQMAQELADFNEKANNKANLYSELKNLDENKKQTDKSQEEIMAKRR